MGGKRQAKCLLKQQIQLILHLSQQSSALFYASLSQSKTILKILHFVRDLKYWVNLVLKTDVTPTISNEAYLSMQILQSGHKVRSNDHLEFFILC